MFAEQALQQALVAAARDGGERARAVRALRGADMFAATWPTDPSSLRTLQNSSGVRALALFTDKRHLDEAGARLGWLGVDGQVPATHVHMSEAIRFARQRQVALVIVDITADHALELDEGEMELVAAAPSSRPPSYRGLGPVVATPLHGDAASEVRRVSTHPPTHPESPEQAAPAATSLLKPSDVQVDANHHAVSATFSVASTATMAALPASPSDDLVDALTQVLREYCEVEWACLVGEVERPRDGALGVALRIDPAFRKHLAEISRDLRQAAGARGARLDVLVLDTVEQMKRARAIGLPFYPWRKR